MTWLTSWCQNWLFGLPFWANLITIGPPQSTVQFKFEPVLLRFKGIDQGLNCKPNHCRTPLNQTFAGLNHSPVQGPELVLWVQNQTTATLFQTVPLDSMWSLWRLLGTSRKCSASGNRGQPDIIIYKTTAFCQTLSRPYLALANPI